MLNVQVRSLAGLWRPTRVSALAIALVLPILATCTNERPTEANPGGLRPGFTTGSVSCANGCKDTFTDADGTLLTSHSPDVGGFTWQFVEGSGTDYRAKITNNAVSIEDPGSLDYQFMYLIPEIAGEDAVEMDLEVYGEVVTTGGIYSLGIILRGDGTVMGGYGFHLQVHTTGGSEGGVASVELFRNNVFFPGSFRSIPPLTRGAHKFRAEASGGTLKAYMDGVLIASASDPAPLQAGNPGFWFGTQTGGRTESFLRITSFDVRPCPPLQERVLSEPAVRAALLQALAASRPTADGVNRRERGGYVYIRDDDGSAFLVEETQPGFTECRSNLLSPSQVPVIAGAHFDSYWHTHPNKEFEPYYSPSCKTAAAGGQVARAGPRDQTGGGSSGDWSWADTFQRSVYVIALGELVWRLDPATLETQWKNNQNKWKFDSQHSCLVHR